MNTSTNWQLLGGVAPTALTDARTQAHWATQLMTAAADAHAPHAGDDSHTNLGWNRTARAFFGHALGDEGAVHVGLRIEDLTILLANAGREPFQDVPLAGHDMAFGCSELEQLLDARLGTVGRRIALRDYDMPQHAVSDGHPFDISDATAFTELQRWYANAAGELQELVDHTDSAAAPRCWPHHFDLATMITLDSGTVDSPAKTIGVGLTPGDGYYAEPYWYVTPYPYPEQPKLGSLAGGGHWHSEGWLGAVLPGTSALDCPADVDAQRTRVRAFLASAIDACRKLLAT